VAEHPHGGQAQCEDKYYKHCRYYSMTPLPRRLIYPSASMPVVHNSCSCLRRGREPKMVCLPLWGEVVEPTVRVSGFTTECPL